MATLTPPKGLGSLLETMFVRPFVAKVDMLEKILKRSFEYLHKAAPSVTNMSAYVIEEDVKSDNLVLRKIVNCSGGKVETL